MITAQELVDRCSLNPDTGCWEWQYALSSEGYAVFGTNRIGQNKTWYAHRCIWELVNGPIPLGLYICHHCDNRLCLNPEHLFVGTQKDNLQDAARKMRFRHSVITPENVLKIRAQRGLKTQRELAREYGVTKGAISMLMRRCSWSHI